MKREIVCDSAEFGENFLQARKRLNLSLSDVVERLNAVGIKSDTGAMSKLERDMQEPGVIWAANAAIALNTTLDRLVYREQPNIPVVSRELRANEIKPLADLLETLCALNDQYPNINWFEVASVSARGTLDTVAEQTTKSASDSLPVGSIISKPEATVKTFDPPKSDPALRLTPEEEMREGEESEEEQENSRVGEQITPYGVVPK